MDEILEVLTQVPGILGCLIVGKDGLVITQSGQINLDVDFLGATTADFFTSAEGMMGEKFNQGTLGVMTIEAAEGNFILQSINEVTFLLVLTHQKVNLGLLRWEIRAAAEKLKDVL